MLLRKHDIRRHTMLQIEETRHTMLQSVVVVDLFDIKIQFKNIISTLLKQIFTLFTLLLNCCVATVELLCCYSSRRGSSIKSASLIHMHVYVHCYGSVMTFVFP